MEVLMFEPRENLGSATPPGRERAGGGARLSRGKAGENISMFDLLDICDEQTWGSSVHIL